MSDGFDKEAEREKLREKLADDDEKREHTQRMSELLLQGATMTNRHCDDCGDPIFRHDGQEFCPTCQAAGSGSGTRGDSQEATQTSIQGAGSAPRTVVKTGGDESPQGDAPDASASPNGAASPRSGAASPSSNAGESRDEPTPAPPTDPTGSESVADARASLTRTLARFARAAEETDDPRRARDNLQAAREAAETLAALD